MKLKILEMIIKLSDNQNITSSIILKKIKDENDESYLELKLRDDFELDSLKLAVLAVKIEDQFNVDVFKESFPITVNDILNKLK